MKKDSRIYVAGNTGLVGTAIIRFLDNDGYQNLLTTPFPEFDLRDQRVVQKFFKEEEPEYVFLAAAKVGGILSNSTYPADFIYDNLMISCNVIHACYQFGVLKLINLGSSCIYPRMAQQPLKEKYLLTGSLELTNEAYAIAKIAGIKLCNYFNKQYNTNFISVMPTNLYGPFDNFNPETSHVIPGMIRKYHMAKNKTLPEVSLWGTGTPKREFLYVDDLVSALIFLVKHHDAKELGEFINIGTGKEITISELAETIRKIVQYDGTTRFDSSKPDGTPRKLLDVSRMKTLGWQATTDLYCGLEKTYNWFLEHEERI